MTKLENRLPTVEQMGNMIHLYWMLLQGARRYGTKENISYCKSSLELTKDFTKRFYHH